MTWMNEWIKFGLWIALSISGAYLLWKFKGNRITWIILILTSVLVGGFLFGSEIQPLSRLQLTLIGTYQGTYKPPAYLSVMVIPILIALFIGRAFCGYACPFGTLQELIYSTPIKKIKLNDRIAKYIRWIFLAFFILIALLLGLSIFGPFNPFFLFSPYSLLLRWSLIGIIGIYLISSALIYRPFCRSICVYGTILSFVGDFSGIRLKTTDKCNNCHRCEKKCPIPLTINDIGSGNCYLCGRCVDSCRRSAIKLTTMNKYTLILATILTLSLAIFILFSDVSPYKIV